MSVNYAKIDERTAKLSSPFGEEIARKWFGDAAVDGMPRYSRGPRKGMLKGMVRWSKVVRGGWVHDKHMPGGGYVESRRGCIIERKLCKLESSRFGDQLGEVVIDLEHERDMVRFFRERIADLTRDLDGLTPVETEVYQESINKLQTALAEKLSQFPTLK